MLCFIDLGWSTSRLGDALPDGRKTPTERGFDLPETVVKGRVARRQEESGLVDAEERVNEGDWATQFVE